jgi:tRNA pseudouridine38-40 synthase
VKNVKLVISYNGSLFHGSQVQDDQDTVQGAIEAAIRKLTKKKTRLCFAGRTDSGVNANGQVANFRTDSPIPSSKFAYVLNGILKNGVRVVSSKEVPMSFDARRSASKREYIYFIFNGKDLPAMLDGRVGQEKKPLNIKLMRKAAKMFQGRHDFSAFCAVDEDRKDHIRRIHEVKIASTSDELLKVQGIKGGKLIYIKISADAFLYKMVRFIVGALVNAGKGELKSDAIAAMLKNGSDVKVKPAVACGLYLNNVKY